MNKMNKKGFTLIEMLVVIAIIAILVSIVVPTVSSATEKAKEAKDAANIRTAIAQVTTEGMASEKNTSITVELTQDGAFEKNTDLKDIAGYALSGFTDADSVTVKYIAADAKVEVYVNKGETSTMLTPLTSVDTEDD